MKRVLDQIIIISVLSLTMLSGCSDNSSGDVKLAFLYSSKVTERYNNESKYFKQEAEKMGATVYVEEADNNEALQYKKALALIDKDIDVLVLIAVNINTATAIVRAAKKNNVKIIAYDRMIMSDQLDLFITGNPKRLGIDMCNAILKHKPRGKYIVLAGDKFDKNATILEQAIDSILAPRIKNKDIEILYKSYIEDWSGKNAAFELNQYLALSGEKPDVIFAAYDGIAYHSIKVLEKFGYDDVLITGQDAELKAVRNIVRGKQFMTIYHPSKILATKAARIAFGMAKGKMPDKSELSYIDNGLALIPTIRTNSIPVFKDNIEDVLIKTGVYTKEEVYQ